MTRTSQQQLSNGSLKNKKCTDEEELQLLGTPLFIRLITSLLFGLIGFCLRYLITPHRRGFYCSDQSIMLPYKDSTVENTTLFIVAIIIVSALILIGEFCFNNNPVEPGKSWPWPWMHSFCQFMALKTMKSFSFTSLWMLGVAMNLILFNVVKLSLGALRPNFLELCHPESAQAKYPCPPELADYYFPGDDYKCALGTEENERDMRILDAKMSFYSGHSTIACFYATFIILYTHLRILQRCRFRDLLLPLFVVFYTCMVALAGYVSLSRIFDNKHHPIDVFCGAFAGTVTAILTVYLHKEMFAPKAICAVHTAAATEDIVVVGSATTMSAAMKVAEGTNWNDDEEESEGNENDEAKKEPTSSTRLQIEKEINGVRGKVRIDGEATVKGTEDTRV